MIKQRGQVLFAATMVLTTMLMLWFSMHFFKPQKIDSKYAQLNLAKRHLLAYALREHLHYSRRIDKYHQIRPGELPCADFNNDQSLPIGDYGAGGKCISHSGWLPYKTLRINPQLLSADLLWYVVDENFSNMVIYGSAAVGSVNEPVLNHHTSVSLRLNGQPMAAIIIHPGRALAGQNMRTANNAHSALSSYLEQENATGDKHFVNKASSAEFNDIAIGISVAEIMQHIEHYAAISIGKRLNLYFLANGAYPAAADNLGNCNLVAKQIEGRLPQNCSGGNYNLKFASKNNTTDPKVWLARNLWLDNISYTRNNDFQVQLHLPSGKTISFTNGVKDA